MDYMVYVMAEYAKHGFAEEEKARCYEMLKRLPVYLLAAQKEGLLHLEEIAWEIPETDAVNKFLRKAILMIVDGTDPDMVKDAMGREIVFLGTETFEAYLCYLALQGVLAIQLGYSRYLFNEILIGCIQPDFREEARGVLEDAELKYVENLRARHFAELPGKKPRKSENPYLSLVMDGVSRLNEEDFLSVINALSGTMLIILMDYAPEELRTKLLENVPQTVWERYLEDVNFTTEEELSETLNKTARLLCGQET